MLFIVEVASTDSWIECIGREKWLSVLRLLSPSYIFYSIPEGLGTGGGYYKSNLSHIRRAGSI